MAQIPETPLLNMLNFETLIATKARRAISEMARRRCWSSGCGAQSRGGANEATRRFLIGGADFSSNVGMSHAGAGAQGHSTPPQHGPTPPSWRWGMGELGVSPGLRHLTRTTVCCWWTPSTRWGAACPTPSKGL
ncbi:MAG: hypothetical protein R2838_16480 [Caldilineaceae bacterium]